MSDQFVAEIRIFGCNFAPNQWALCNGQLLPISQNTALFSLLGTTYGGNGTSNFALPNLQSRVPMFYQQGPGLSDHVEGEMSGTETVTVLQTQMPSHTHLLGAKSSIGDNNTPSPNLSLARSSNATVYQPINTPPGTPTVQFAPQAVGLAGNNQPHNNLQPFLTLNFCIALQGIFPARP